MIPPASVPGEGEKRFDRLLFLPRPPSALLYPLDFFRAKLMNDESDEKKVNYRAHIYEWPRRGPKGTGRNLAETLGGFKLTVATYHS